MKVVSKWLAVSGSGGVPVMARRPMIGALDDIIGGA